MEPNELFAPTSLLVSCRDGILPCTRDAVLPPWVKASYQKRDNKNVTDLLPLPLSSLCPPQLSFILHLGRGGEKVLALQNLFNL